MLVRMTSPALFDFVRCPACYGAFGELTPEFARCDQCDVRYPIGDGLPWLFRDVEGSRAQWAAKLQQFRSEILSDLSELEAAAERASPLPSIQTRLSAQHEGLTRLGEQVFQLLESFALSHNEAGAGLPKDRIPTGQHVTSYLETAFRDWCWGDPEILDTMTLVGALMDAGEVALPADAKVLVLGGGAGRLAWELSAQSPSRSVIQLDVNPILSVIGSKVAAGEEVELTELPRFPLSVDDADVNQILAVPVGDGNPQFLIGDAFAPPFAPETFDLLVTPWFIDIVPESFHGLAARLKRMLVPGGRWIAFGPLSFESQGLAHRFTPEEIVDLLEDVGFEVDAAGTESVAYLHSPHSMQRRGEEILAFSVHRTGEIELVDDFAYYPEWMTDGRIAIPEEAGFETLRSERTFDVEILKCIDGRASIEDIVTILSSRYGLAPDRCRNTVERFFAKWVDGV